MPALLNQSRCQCMPSPLHKNKTPAHPLVLEDASEHAHGGGASAVLVLQPDFDGVEGEAHDDAGRAGQEARNIIAHHAQVISSVGARHGAQPVHGSGSIAKGRGSWRWAQATPAADLPSSGLGASQAAVTLPFCHSNVKSHSLENNGRGVWGRWTRGLGKSWAGLGCRWPNIPRKPICVLVPITCSARAPVQGDSRAHTHTHTHAGSTARPIGAFDL